MRTAQLTLQLIAEKQISPAGHGITDDYRQCSVIVSFPSFARKPCRAQSDGIIFIYLFWLSQTVIWYVTIDLFLKLFVYVFFGCNQQNFVFFNRALNTLMKIAISSSPGYRNQYLCGELRLLQSTYPAISAGYGYVTCRSNLSSSPSVSWTLRGQSQQSWECGSHFTRSVPPNPLGFCLCLILVTENPYLVRTESCLNQSQSTSYSKQVTDLQKCAWQMCTEGSNTGGVFRSMTHKASIMFGSTLHVQTALNCK